MKQPNPFVVIVDKNGDIWHYIPRGASMQEVISSVDHHDKCRSWGAPHGAWLWNGAVWYPFKIPSIP